VNIKGLSRKGIRVEVDFYDDEQKQKLLAYPSADRMTELAEEGVLIPVQEFLTYYLFHKKRPGKSGYQSYGAIGLKIGRALSELEDWILFNKVSISVPADVAPQDKAITERIGESIGLAVVNRIHRLTEADWGKLGEICGRDGRPTFDYQVASDGQKIVQVETKGSCLANNSKKTSAISNHKNSIVNKKTKIRGHEQACDYKYPAELRYGTITVLDYRPNSVAKCWLLDPDPEPVSMPPARLRLINRMSFLRDWISFISPRSQFAAALSTRLADLIAVTDPMDLDGVPLRKGNGEELVIETLGGSAFFMNKARVSDGPSVGVVMQASKDALVYLGIRDDLAVIAGKQDFHAIVNSQYEVGTVRKDIDCIVSKTRFRHLKLPGQIKEQARESGGYFSFNLPGHMNYSQEGLVFGLLPLTPNDE
jgi:hypothetical protein